MPPDPPDPRPWDVSPAPHLWLAAWRARTWRWWRLQIVAEATLWAMVAATAAHLLTGNRWIVALAGLATLVGRTMSGNLARDVRTMLSAVETSRPSLHNALLTWHEADQGTLALAPAFRERLVQQAEIALEGLPGPAARTWRDWARAGATLVVVLIAAWLLPGGLPGTSTVMPAAVSPTSAAARSVSVVFRVNPPAYVGRPATDIGDEDLVQALVGSTVRATFTGVPDGAAFRVADQELRANVEGGRGTAVTFGVDGSALLTVQDATGRPLRTTAIQAIADAAPIVRVTQPGRDLRVADAARVIPVAVTADDDIGLRSLRLMYTRVTGSGENFEFIDGELPLTVQRGSATSWQGRARIGLAALAMAPGDTLVYYAAARDGRPYAAGLAESERYLVDIPRRGDLAGGDFSLPEPEARYAVSQRMVILLTERLLERRSRTDPTEYLREAQGLAVQQRRVRAEFVFLMGGDVVDEVEEAEHSHEVEAGRLDNSGQQELLDAVRQMAQAEQRLTDGNLAEALPYEYRALNALQAAFGKARYFMRTLPTTVAIDVSRRGSGDLDLAASSAWERTPLQAGDISRAQEGLARLSTLSPTAAVADVSSLADALVQLDGGTAVWLQVVQQLLDAFARDHPTAERQAALDAVADALRARLMPAVPSTVRVPLPRGQDEASLAKTGRPVR